MTIFYPHLIPDHFGGTDKERIALWAQMQRASGATPFIKIVGASNDGMPPQIENMPQDAVFIIRDYLTSTNWGQRGIRDANAAVDMAWQHAARARGIAEMVKERCGNLNLLFEGLNEPEVWGSEPPGLVAFYEAERLRWLHSFGLHGVVLNFSVGWPNNKGADTPPDWEPFNVVRDAMKDGDYLGLHEYWAFHGPQENWGWWAGRFTQCPWDVPILVTECGIDTVVAGESIHHGWQHLPLATMDDKAWQYVQWLRWYEQQFDRRIKGACAFTWDIGNKEWETFDIRSDVFWQQWLPYLQDMSITPPTKEPEAIPIPVEPEVWGHAKITPYRKMFEDSAAAHGVDAMVLATIAWIESGGTMDSGFISSSKYHEVGVMQIIPGEIDGFSERPSTTELLKPEVNIDWGGKILAWYVKLFGDLRKGLMAYNWGEGNVASHPDATDVPSTKYIAKFCAAWKELWNAPLPFAEAANTVDITAVRWQAEESVRQIEAAITGLQAARQRLLDNIIAPLYNC